MRILPEEETLMSWTFQMRRKIFRWTTRRLNARILLKKLIEKRSVSLRCHIDQENARETGYRRGRKGFSQQILWTIIFSALISKYSNSVGAAKLPQQLLLVRLWASFHSFTNEEEDSTTNKKLIIALRIYYIQLSMSMMFCTSASKVHEWVMISLTNEVID